MSLSKVKSCQGAGDWSNEHGTFYKFEYTMEDGKILTASHKKQEGFPIGAPVEYEIKGTNDHGSYGSVKKPDSGNYTQSNAKPMDNTTQLQIVRQNALGHATAICIHNALCTDATDGANMVDPIEVIEIAENLAKYVQSPADTPSEKPQTEVKPEPAPIPEEQSDDLPF